ncbi:MAG: hypothetical protein IJI58_00745 [Bacilli bacterium]|nr:hypothetical protein [Bacilli bacterium]
MASSIIHIAIAKKVLEKVEVDNRKDYFLGAIAPDIAKQIGLNRDISHFVINSKEDVPNVNIFIRRYPYFKYNSFDLGYYTHLYADKIWFDEFLPNFIQNSSLKLLDGTIVNMPPGDITQMIYNDYTNLNIRVIETYDLDLSLFYEEFQVPETNITEIPVDKLDILINKMGILLENSKKEKTYTLDMYLINDYIDRVSKEIIEELKKY